MGGRGAVGQSQPNAGLVGWAGVGGEQVVVDLENEQAAGLQLVSDVVLEEGLGGAWAQVSTQADGCSPSTPSSPKQVQPWPGVASSLAWAAAALSGGTAKTMA